MGKHPGHREKEANYEQAGPARQGLPASIGAFAPVRARRLVTGHGV